MVKVGRKRNTRKVCKNASIFTKSGREILQSRG